MLMTVNMMETRRKNGMKKTENTMHQYMLTKFIMQFDQDFLFIK